MYEEEKEFNVLKGQIPDFGYDIKMLSVVVNGEKSKSIPSRGLYKTQIDCSNGTTGEWDYNAWNLTLENVSENAKCNITFTSNLTEEEYDKYIEAGVSLRRNTYRGKDITSYLSASGEMNLYTQISSGRFNDIYVGDYIVASNITWLVADIDNYLYTGDTPLTKHHVTMISKKAVGVGFGMNDTNTTEGGYYNSKMKQERLPSILSTYVEPAFSGHVLTYRNFLTNAVTPKITSAWYDSQIDLMSEVNVYGVSLASSEYNDNGIDNQQYALFRLKPNFISTEDRMTYYLKNVLSSNTFVMSFREGYPASYNPQNSLSIRPRFLIG